MRASISRLENKIHTWQRHIHALAEEIGPRGSTTEGERLASLYCHRVLRRLGLDAKIETFMSARSIYHPHLVAAAAILLAFLIYPLYGRISAALSVVLILLALCCELLELSFHNNPIRAVIAKARSQNVIATIPPAGDHRQDLILIGHVDSHRTPVIFKNKTWLTAYVIFVTSAFFVFFSQAILYTLGIQSGWRWIWPATIICAVYALVLGAMCLHADSTPFSKGANDNATAAGIVLTLAEHLKSEPLKHTRVWLACTGCEEVQHYGAIDFFHRHRAEFRNPKAVVFEMLGCDGPAWLTKEGIIVPFHADRELVELAETIAGENPELKGFPTRVSGGNTEMADALRQNIPAITLSGIDAKGFAPYWHQPEDTYDKMDAGTLTRNYAFTWLFIRALDGKAALG